MEIDEIISRYEISLPSEWMIKQGLKKGNICCHAVEKIKRENAEEIIKTNKAAIIAELNRREAAAKKAIEDRNAKIAAIEGLEEIQAVRKAWNNYWVAFDRMMEDEDNDGVNPPKRPTVLMDDLLAKYPRASAYLEAESYSMSGHFAKSAVGKKAVERIINGEDYEAALLDMEAEWTDFCKEAIEND